MTSNNYIDFTYDSFFVLEHFFGSAEMFIGYSLLQLSLYSIVLSKLNRLQIRKSVFPNFYTVGVFIFFFASLLLLNEDTYIDVHELSSFKLSIYNDFFSFLAKEIICISTLIFFLSSQFNKQALSLGNSFEYTAFTIASALGSMIICSAGDLITAYLAIELQSISFYLMACSKKNSNYSIESGLKYFIIGSFSSAFFLLGSSFLYFACGTLNFIEIQVLLSLLALSPQVDSFSFINLGFALLGLSLFVKLSVAPFHLWSIDVYESSPTPTTYFFAVIPKLGLFVLFTRMFFFVYLPITSLNFWNLCFVFAIFSIVFGSLGGVEQRKVKSLLAYSSLTHTGYVLLSFSANTPTSLHWMFSYLIFYMITALSFWCVILGLKRKSENFNSKKTNKELGDLTLLQKSNPTLAVLLTIITFSLAGVPPLIGFLIKFGVFFTSIQASAYLIGSVGILLSLISTFYYLRLVKIIFFENVVAGKLYHPIDNTKALLISLLTAALILLFIKPSLIYLLVIKAFSTPF